MSASSADGSSLPTPPPTPPPIRLEVSSGGVVFRRTAHGIDVVLAEQRDARTNQDTVRLPKGRLEAGEGPEEAALREVKEETGVAAVIIETLDEIRYAYLDPRQGRRIEKRVHFYLMKHESGDPHPADGEMQHAYWCPIDAAAQRLTFPGERSTVCEAARRLEGGTRSD